jgi:hypothetical protein
VSAPLRHPVNGHKLNVFAVDIDKLAENFAGHCKNRSLLVLDGTLPRQLAVDELQAVAKLTGLSRRKGWDFVQSLMNDAFAAIDTEICANCERSADQHYCVDTPKGRELFCDGIDAEITLRAADLVRQWELDDPRDRWKHTGEAPPPPELAPIPARPYRSPKPSVDAFLWLASQENADALAEWLKSHKRDAPYLLKIWKARQCR